MLPGGAVAIDYAAPDRNPERFVRQEFIEVYQAPWTSERSSLDLYSQDIATDPDPAKSLVEIAGVPALIVEPHSKKDIDEANPAFVRFELNGIEVQLSGGEDLDLLLDVADSLIRGTGEAAA
jgi:hypothetical protein